MSNERPLCPAGAARSAPSGVVASTLPNVAGNARRSEAKLSFLVATKFNRFLHNLVRQRFTAAGAHAA